MTRLIAVALGCAWTAAAYEHGTSTGMDGWLEDHNYFRCLHNAEPVSWDYGLEEKARYLADQQTMSHTPDVYNVKPSSGENIAMGGGTFTCGDYTGPYNQNCATYNWYHEYTDCWSPITGWQPGMCTIGHFTAMVWKGVTKIGCASSGNYHVCEYGSDRCMDGIDGGCSSPSPPGVPNFNSGSCGDECVEAAVNTDAACKATNDILPDPSGDAGSFSSWWWPVSSNKGGESGVLWKGLLAWAVVSVICFAIFGADAAGKYHICESSEAAAAKPAGGAPPAGDGAVEEQPGIELAATSEA